MKQSAIALSCQNSRVGKLLPGALYVHVSALFALDFELQSYENLARSAKVNIEEATLVKFNLDKPKISYLFYPEFESDPHPALQLSVIVDLETLEVTHREYKNSDNPPILHRKETFVTPDYFLYEEFAELTRFEIALGLLDESRFIGTRQEWQQRLCGYGIGFEGHRLVCPIDPTSQHKQNVRIDRHKAAIIRKEFSRPVRLALEAGLFESETTFFDYGCGYGGDVERARALGYISSGWDPYYHPDSSKTLADIVNLGYVINVIEDPLERKEALVRAWELTSRVLVVAAQVLIDDRARGVVAYGDGIVTSRNTFQKYYRQEELKIYIDRVLEVDAIPAGLGIYFVFKDETRARAFRASRFRSRAIAPKVKNRIKTFEEYREILSPLMNFFTERGRLPVRGELPEEENLKAEFGSVRRAFKVILQATDEREWQAISSQRARDLELYLALSQFDRRPQPKELDPQVLLDIKVLFGNYKQACLSADRMLFSLSDLKNIANCCSASPVGKRSRNSLLVHISALEILDPILRLYEGCASRTIGRLEDANVIKFNFRQPKISYLFYPDFDIDPHPVLNTSMEIDLSDLQVRYQDFDRDDNPPVLHEKDALVTKDYPFYEKFSKLTRQEKYWGLLEDTRPISHLREWLKCLEDRCATIKGHQVQWRKDSDPYKIKLLRSQINARKRNNVL